MRKFFGTDGIRGIANKDITCDIAFNCGNALTFGREKIKVAIGRDTRNSGDMLFSSFCAGVTAGGGDVFDLGIIPTAGVAFMTRYLKADYGIVISASHNPSNYNGIKIFGANGYKLADEMELNIESLMGVENYVDECDIGNVIVPVHKNKPYLESLIETSCQLNKMKIVLDLANGAASEIAPSVFESLGAEVIVINKYSKGSKINYKCGCLYPEALRTAVLNNKADIGASFDGDSDRLIICDNLGNILNGDMILFVLALYLKKKGLLKNNTVVGTLHTNMGIEKELKQNDITFLRSDIGDRYVIELMRSCGAVLGGEQSGHIILNTKSTTGDGILAALMLCEIMKEENKSLFELCFVEQFPQENINVKVDNKNAVLASDVLQNMIAQIETELCDRGRILVRASGTESKIRIMAECEDATLAQVYAYKLAETINEIANLEDK